MSNKQNNVCLWIEMQYVFLGVTCIQPYPLLHDESVAFCYVVTDFLDYSVVLLISDWRVLRIVFINAVSFFFLLL